VIVGVVRYRQFITSAVLAAALTVVWIAPGAAQTQEAAPHEQSPAENNSAAEASKQAANPLASVWLMQFQQNNTWIGMPANGGNRVQSNLQFQPLLSVKLTDDWSLVTRPVLTLFNTTPFQDQTGKDMRVTAFGDTTLALAVAGHRLVGNWLLAAGPTFIFPTATNSLIGQNKWQVGPAAAVGYIGKNFVTHVFPQQWFSVGGDGRRIREMSLIYAFVYLFKRLVTIVAVVRRHQLSGHHPRGGREFPAPGVPAAATCLARHREAGRRHRAASAMAADLEGMGLRRVYLHVDRGNCRALSGARRRVVVAGRVALVAGGFVPDAPGGSPRFREVDAAAGRDGSTYRGLTPGREMGWFHFLHKLNEIPASA
jgi:hypothetical protein